jgi:hypothetical protein
MEKLLYFMKGIYMRFIPVCLFIAVSAFFPAMGTTQKNKKPETTKQVMNEVFQAFINLLPYAADEKKWQDPKVNSYIQTNLSKIATSFDNSTHIKMFALPGFKPSYDVVRDHVRATLEAFNSDHKVFARSRMKATTQICMSCHTQLPDNKLSSTFKALRGVQRNDFQSAMEYADFLFLVRDYKRATTYYKQEIENRLDAIKKKSKKTPKEGGEHYLDFTIENSLRRVVTIYTKVNFAPEKAIDFLTPYLKRQELSIKMQSNIASWLEQLNKWKVKKWDGKISTEGQFENFVKENLLPLEDSPLSDGSQDVSLLVSSGAFYHYLGTFPTGKKTPEALYWLAFIDRQLDHNYFYSLADLYLRECITKFPRDSFAKRCYQSYEDSIIFGYSGSGGVSVPKEEQEELKRLKAYLKE